MANYRKGHDDQIGHCEVRGVVRFIGRHKGAKEIAKQNGGK